MADYNDKWQEFYEAAASQDEDSTRIFDTKSGAPIDSASGISLQGRLQKIMAEDHEEVKPARSQSGKNLLREKALMKSRTKAVILSDSERNVT